MGPVATLADEARIPESRNGALHRESPPRQHAVAGNHHLRFVANRPAEHVRSELAPHPCAHQSTGHHQCDYACPTSPAVEEGVHGGMIPTETTGQNCLSGSCCRSALAICLSAKASGADDSRFQYVCSAEPDPSFPRTRESGERRGSRNNAPRRARRPRRGTSTNVPIARLLTNEQIAAVV